MMLRSLLLSQFRCFDSLRLEIPREIVLFHGSNAQGKTSLLEAICILLRLQSPRATALSECVQFSHSAFGVAGSLEGEETTVLRFQYGESGRKLLLDGESQRNAAEYLRHSALVVWMSNEDLALVRGGGEQRRRFLDFMASQLYPGYRETLKSYEKALRSRNWLLKRDARPEWSQIDAYARILDQNARILTRCRRALVESLAPLAARAQKEIAACDESLRIVYKSASGEDDDLFAALGARRDEELRRRVTVSGPHRDDLKLMLDDKPVAKYASEGQQRTVALALKSGQANLFLQSRPDPPVILIDDIFGELDPNRRNALMAHWPQASQKLIATTHLDWLDDRFTDAARMRVSAAQVERER